MDTSNHRVAINSPSAIVALGLCALAVGLAMAQRTNNFVTRAVPAVCTVDSTARRSFSVWCERPHNVRQYITVRKPWLAAPWAYGRGEKVAILFEPEAFDEVDPLLLIFSSPPARVHSALHIWTPAVSVLLAAMILIALGAWSSMSRGRFRAEVNLDLGTSMRRS